MRRSAWPAVFAACVVAAGLRSILLGKDANWDLKNYHFYNAWALLNGRIGVDVAPAQLQTWHSPLADLPFYWLVNAFAEPRWVAFWMALPVAIVGFFLLRMLALLFPFDRARANGTLWIAAAAAVGLTGSAGAATWGTTMNEWPPAALLMAGLWLAVRAAIQEHPAVEGGGAHRRAFAWAGLLVGCAVGVKLTYAVFALGFLVACLAFGSVRERIVRTATAGAMAAIGFLACYGWWGWILWREFANPFFPYFNAWFQSPWWEPVNFFDRTFGPRDWRQWIFFPVYFARRHLLVAEVSFRDYRLAALLAVALAAWIVSRVRNLRENPHAAPPIPAREARAWWLLGVFTLVSYLAWLKLYGIYRYLVPLELLSGALVVGGILYVFQRGRVRVAVVIVLAALLVGTTRPGSWGRIPFGSTYFDVAAPAIPADSLVIVGYRHPFAYAAPFFPAGTRFVSPVNNFLDIGQHNRLAKKADAAIRGHTGPRYLLSYKQRTPHDDRTLAHFGLAVEEARCMAVPSSMDDDHMRLCPLRGTSPGPSAPAAPPGAKYAISAPPAARRRARRSRATPARA